MKKRRYLLPLLLLLHTTCYVQTLHLDAAFRPRFEVRDGFRRLQPVGTTPAVLISQRTRLALTYETEQFRFRVVPKDVRLWGSEELAGMFGVFGDEASVDLHEAYADIRLRPGLWLAIGRQELSYDNQALLSNRNWNQHGASSDAVVIRYRHQKWNIHSGGTWNTLEEQLTDNLFPPDRLKTLGFLWVNRSFLNNTLQLSALHIATGVTETDSTSHIRFRQTSGLYAGYRKQPLRFTGSIYYQYGVNRTGTPVSAWLADADLALTLSPITPGIGLGYLSGNDQTPQQMTTDRSFYDIYRAKHRYFGFMDYFLNVPVHTAHGGLVNIYTYLHWKINDKLSVQNTLHHFRLAQTNPNTPTQKDLGMENNLVLRYRFQPWGAAEAGYMFFLPTKAMNTLHNVEENKFPQFFYLMLTLTPRLLTYSPPTD